MPDLNLKVSYQIWPAEPQVVQGASYYIAMQMMRGPIYRCNDDALTLQVASSNGEQFREK